MALDEDRASSDVTTLATVDAALQGRAVFVAKEAGVLAGMQVAAEVFRQIDPGVSVTQAIAEGKRFPAGTELAAVEGPVRALLQGERVALNFLQRLCATATLTRAFVDAV